MKRRSPWSSSTGRRCPPSARPSRSGSQAPPASSDPLARPAPASLPWAQANRNRSESYATEHEPQGECDHQNDCDHGSDAIRRKPSHDRDPPPPAWEPASSVIAFSFRQEGTLPPCAAKTATCRSLYSPAIQRAARFGRSQSIERSPRRLESPWSGADIGEYWERQLAARDTGVRGSGTETVTFSPLTRRIL